MCLPMTHLSLAAADSKTIFLLFFFSFNAISEDSIGVCLLNPFRVKVDRMAYGTIDEEECDPCDFHVFFIST